MTRGCGTRNNAIPTANSQISHEMNAIGVTSKIDCETVSDRKNDLLEEPRYAVESTFISVLTATETLTGKLPQPYAVWFQYSRPVARSEYDRSFQAEVHFSMPTNRMFFDANCLKKALSANSQLLSLFEQQAEAMLDAIDREENYTHKEVALRLLKHPDCPVTILLFCLAFLNRALFIAPSNAGQDKLPIDTENSSALGRCRKHTERHSNK
jgi:hypothetical protein